jgi:hypothetical protein
MIQDNPSVHNLSFLGFAQSKLTPSWHVRKTQSLLVLILVFASIFNATAQEVFVHGRVYDPTFSDASFNLMVVNRTTKKGVFGSSSGEFSLYMDKNDTLLISAHNYKTMRFSLSDSTLRNEYQVAIPLLPITYELPQAYVFPERSFREIERDISQLQSEVPFSTTGVHSFMSPISALYERFSRFEKSKRRATELYNEQMLHDILKELFRMYVKADIIHLSEREFQEFIEYMDLPVRYIQSVSQYDLIMRIKKEYEDFDRKKKMEKSEDYYYHSPLLEEK